MKHKLVSKSGQMESLVVCEGMLDEGHRCGACHNVSDTKVRMINRNQESEYALKMSVCVCVPSIGCVRALYLRPWWLAVVIVNAFSSNASSPIMGLLRGSQRFAWWIL